MPQFIAELAGTIPEDDTVPLSTEGTQIFSQSFTPQNATSTIIIKTYINMGPSGYMTIEEWL